MIGVDIESISRFENLDKKSGVGFLEKIFTTDELEYCFKKKNPAPHLAARFVAKEAVFKSLSSAGLGELSLDLIEIQKTENGAPRIKIHNNNFENVIVQISISHTSELAIAFALIQKT